jgi:hypothetical protein
MKRTLKDTDRTVEIILHNRDRQEVWDMGDLDVWMAHASIDGETWAGAGATGPTPDTVFALIAQALHKSGDLDDLPAPMPDNPMLRALLIAAADSWAGGDLPDWREEEYLRGQIEMIWNTCNVRTPDEDEIDGDAAKDRIWTWIKKEM